MIRKNNLRDGAERKAFLSQKEQNVQASVATEAQRY
jgi:hypothetical protein